MNVVSKDRMKSLNMFGSHVEGEGRGTLGLAENAQCGALSNDGLLLAVGFKKNPVIVIYRWNGKRWQTECDENIPARVCSMHWDEQAICPSLVLKLFEQPGCVRVACWVNGWEWESTD